ncbi:MAG: hypothetical protein M1813_006404 [Trichoglossum hirsutum]|nr:MAG: hypothetical protein M1813_006404 [Trichoglossum hirsutum]
MKDLQPYICIHDPCPTQDILYDSEAAWLKHEQWEHAYRWCCDSPDHSLVTFSVADEFKNHMREAHSETFQEHQLQGLADASKRPALAAFEFCPLCGVTSESLGNPQVSSEASIPDAQALAVQATTRTEGERFVTTKALEDLQKHVARHLWHSAMIALPGRDDLDEVESVSNTGSRKSKSDTFDIFDTPIDGLEPCPFVEKLEEPAELTLSDNELLWERDFPEVLGDRYGEDLGLEKVLVFAWPRDEFHQVSKIEDGVDRLHEDNRERHKEHQSILDWLTPVDYALQQGDFIARRQEGTGLWLLESNKFRGWVKQGNQTLFCPGIPGAGKTIITSVVVEYLCTRFQGDETVGIAYIYCNFRRQQEQEPGDLLASLLKQLVQEQPATPESVKRLHERYENKRTRPSFEEISKALQSVVADYSKVFIIIDALDECQVSVKGCKKLLSEIFNVQAKTGANLFATSRSIPEIIEMFNEGVSLEIRASADDVRRYLDEKMSLLPPIVRRDFGLQEEIKTEIIKNVDGMYVPSYAFELTKDN